MRLEAFGCVFVSLGVIKMNVMKKNTVFAASRADERNDHIHHLITEEVEGRGNMRSDSLPLFVINAFSFCN